MARIRKGWLGRQAAWRRAAAQAPVAAADNGAGDTLERVPPARRCALRWAKKYLRKVLSLRASASPCAETRGARCKRSCANRLRHDRSLLPQSPLAATPQSRNIEAPSGRGAQDRRASLSPLLVAAHALGEVARGGRDHRDAFAAGVKLRGWCETLFRGAKTQSWDVPIDHGGRLGAANDGDLIGPRRLQAVASNLGREWFAVLQMTVIDDLPWARIGTALGLTPKTAKTRAIIALQILVGWFREESAHRDDSGLGSHRRRRD
jgi:hypothetical protein